MTAGDLRGAVLDEAQVDRVPLDTRTLSRDDDQACWLTSLAPDTVLCLTTSVMKRPRGVLRGSLLADGEAVPVRAHLLHLADEPAAEGAALMLLRFTKPLPTDVEWTSLTLGVGLNLKVEPAESGSKFSDLRTFMRESLTAREPSTRNAILEFLTQTCLADQATAQIELSIGLHAIREALRERRSPSTIAKDVPQALYIETIVRVDATGFYIRGWARDTTSSSTRFTAISPEGARIDLGDRFHRYPRPDLDEFYGTPAGEDLGLLAFFDASLPSALANGWVFEAVNAEGSAIEFEGPPVGEDARIGRDVILADLYHERPGAHGFTEAHLHPALSRIQARYGLGGRVDRVVQFGTPPPAPDISVIVPLYGRIDFVEQQLAQFVHDAAFRTIDLIYVLDSPELADELVEFAGALEPLYRLPFRVVLLDRNSGFALANNMGASVAKGRLLVLMNSDILPGKPGWLRTMQEYYDATPDVGALGPKLLYEDGSVQHAGLFFYYDRAAREWNNDHYFKGMHGSLPAANIARKVPAVTAACMMIDAKLYASAGGLQGSYVQGDFEDSDLCLRLFQQGYRSWYLPRAELYHLEGQSYPSSMRKWTGRFNRWLHTHLWGSLIPAVMAELDPAAPGAAPTTESVSIRSSSMVPLAKARMSKAFQHPSKEVD